jgi:hypothetical protein
MAIRSYGDDVSASVVSQFCNKGETRVFGAYVDEGISLRRHLLEHVGAWLRANARTYRIMGGYEEFMDREIRSELWRTVDEVFSGEWTTITAPCNTSKCHAGSFEQGTARVKAGNPN